ncbi:uncharacterized protein [Macrobrachium rosenbergii]|uniref:uncharacterized protein n=1 Tax=Macrobrachium rosenbergii TaxID=79674 RepID=UPI0034D4E8CD
MKRSIFIFLALVGSATSDKGIGLSGSYGPPAEGHLIIENLAAGHAGGGFGGLNCYPQTHYQTHYKTQIEYIPVYKTVVSTQLVPQPVTEVLYETIYKKHTAFVTKTEYSTDVNIITKVDYDPYTETLNKFYFRPLFVTETVFLTQDQPVYLTATEIVTEFRQVPIQHTQYSTAVVTITNPVTLTHKSEVIDERIFTITETVKVIQPIVVTETVAYPGPIIPEEVYVLNTKKIVSIKPAYVTSTFFTTHFVTTTNIERVPVYVTKTAFDHCKPAGSYGLPAVPAVSLDLNLAGSNVVAGVGTGYSYSEPAIGLNIRQSRATAKTEGSGPVVFPASGGPVSLNATAGSEVVGGITPGRGGDTNDPALSERKPAAAAVGGERKALASPAPGLKDTSSAEGTLLGLDVVRADGGRLDGDKDDESPAVPEKRKGKTSDVSELGKVVKAEGIRLSGEEADDEIGKSIARTGLLDGSKAKPGPQSKAKNAENS